VYVVKSSIWRPDMPDRVAQGVVGRRPVGVGDDDLALRLGPGDVLDNRQHRGDSRPRSQQQRAI